MADVDPGPFGLSLRQRRIAAGLTQEALAERSGISVDAISALENGRRRRPRLETVRLLASALRLGPEDQARLEALARARPRPVGAADAETALERPAGAPPGPTGYFVGREAELAELRRRLGEARRVAVHGLGGAGKTQLVVRYAHLQRHDYPDGVFWLRADEESSLLGDLTALAWRLDLPERGASEQDRQIEGVTRWLESHPRWLLVLDDLEPSVQAAVRRWLPVSLPGDVLATSRAPLWPARQALGPLPTAVATRFLLERTGQADEEAAATVARALGCLPLALEQAAAFLEVSGRDLASYAELLRTRLLDLMAEGRPEDHPPVATTWRLSFERLEVESPAAAALLRLCAFLAPDDIPTGVLQDGAGELPDELRTALTDEVELDRTVMALRRYSLMDRRGDALSVHRLVQAVVGQSLAPGEQAAWLAAAIRVLRAAFPEDAQGQPEEWPACARLLAHVQVVERLAAERPVEPDALSWLLDRVGGYLDARAEFGLARPLLERALAIRERTAGPDHPDTAETLGNLAVLHDHRGDAAAARPLYDRALAIRERALGPDHPQTATSLNDLAVLLHRQGQLAVARPLYERALRIDERALGPDHPDIAKDLNNLARLLRAQGELAAAEPLLVRALAIAERTVGPDHPLTATSLNNLARLLRERGEPVAARPLLERSLAIYERVLGPDHPYTAIALVNLSELARERGELDAAREHAERALVIHERVLGPDHPDGAASMTGLAQVLRAQGDLAGARRLLERAVAVRERVAGAADPLTAESRRALDEVTAELGG